MNRTGRGSLDAGRAPYRLARVGMVSEPMMRGWYEQVMAAARSALGAAAYAACEAEGSRLAEEQAITLGLAASSETGTAR